MNLSNDEIESYYQQIIGSFEKVDNFEVDDYYGVAAMSVKKNDNVQIRLQYDYGAKHPVNGKPIEIEDADEAMLVYYVLMNKRVKVRINIS